MSKKRGFTLLELLVVIGIIGILVATGTVAFTAAQARGRDAKRRGDIQAISKALEQYNAANSSSYPAADCTGYATYIAGSTPVDPKTGASYSCTSTSTTYCVCAAMEGTNTGNADASCDFGAGTKTHFCAVNLQ